MTTDTKPTPEDVDRLFRRQAALRASASEAFAHHLGHRSRSLYATTAEAAEAFRADDRVLAFRRANREWRLAKAGNTWERIEAVIDQPDELVRADVARGFGFIQELEEAADAR